MSKFGTNVGKSVGAVGKAAFFGARAALSRRKENQLKKKMGGDEVTTSTPTPSTQKALPSLLEVKLPRRKLLKDKL